MRFIVLALLGLNLAVHYGLWLGHHSVSDLVGLKHDTGLVQRDVDEAGERNRALRAEVEDLRTGLDAVEERARADLGLVKPDETFFQVIEASASRR